MSRPVRMFTPAVLATVTALVMLAVGASRDSASAASAASPALAALAAPADAFLAAKPVWPVGRSTEKNLQVVFRAVVDAAGAKSVILRLTGSTICRVTISRRWSGWRGFWMKSVAPKSKHSLRRSEERMALTA